jgi:hypothetical protein
MSCKCNNCHCDHHCGTECPTCANDVCQRCECEHCAERPMKQVEEWQWADSGVEMGFAH